jgi:hypothetical protein
MLILLPAIDIEADIFIIEIDTPLLTLLILLPPH